MQQLGKLLTLEAKQATVLHGIIVPLVSKRVECEVGDVTELKEEHLDPIPFKNFGSMTIAEKRFLIKASHGNDTVYTFRAEPKQMLDDADLMLLFEYLQWQYMLPEVALAKPAAVKIATHLGTSEQAGMLALLQLKDAMAAFQHLVLPVHCDAPLHWTFLVLHLKKDSAEIVSVEYYDWLNGLVESARIAQRLLSLLTFEEGNAESVPMQLPVHRNHYRQAFGSNDCGFAAWQALEDCMKSVRGECVGVFPRPVAWRTTLKIVLTSLKLEQDKWKMEFSKGGKPKHPVCLPGTKKSGAAAAPLKLHLKEFFTCASCRWSASGAGCCYCNPAKFEELAETKQKRSRQMAAVLKKALDRCSCPLCCAGISMDIPAHWRIHGYTHHGYTHG